MFAYLNPVTAQTIYDCDEYQDLCFDDLVDQDVNDTSTVVGGAAYKYIQKFDNIFPNIDVSEIKYYQTYPKEIAKKKKVKKKKNKQTKFLCQISYRVFLNSPQNHALFRERQELSKLIIEATKNGIIRPFMSTKLENRMPLNQFKRNIQLPTEDSGLSEEDLASGFGEAEEDWGSDSDWGSEDNGAMNTTKTYNSKGKTPEFNTESYAFIEKSTFSNAFEDPLSTFSIDVDKASYSNVRRIINSGKTPPVDAVRIEEMINYFNYDYPQPEKKVPFSVSTEFSSCPWNDEAQLIHIGIQGKEIPKKNLPPSNIVFLLDVSGSMEDGNKLPLLKESFKLLVNELRSKDRVAIVVYAGAAGLILPSTSGKEKLKIIDSFDNFECWRLYRRRRRNYVGLQNCKRKLQKKWK